MLLHSLAIQFRCICAHWNLRFLFFADRNRSQRSLLAFVVALFSLKLDLFSILRCLIAQHGCKVWLTYCCLSVILNNQCINSNIKGLDFGLQFWELFLFINQWSVHPRPIILSNVQKNQMILMLQRLRKTWFNGAIVLYWMALEVSDLWPYFWNF